MLTYGLPTVGERELVVGTAIDTAICIGTPLGKL